MEARKNNVSCPWGSSLGRNEILKTIWGGGSLPPPPAVGESKSTAPSARAQRTPRRRAGPLQEASPRPRSASRGLVGRVFQPPPAAGEEESPRGGQGESRVRAGLDGAGPGRAGAEESWRRGGQRGRLGRGHGGAGGEPQGHRPGALASHDVGLHGVAALLLCLGELHHSGRGGLGRGPAGFCRCHPHVPDRPAPDHPHGHRAHQPVLPSQSVGHSTLQHRHGHLQPPPEAAVLLLRLPDVSGARGRVRLQFRLPRRGAGPELVPVHRPRRASPALLGCVRQDGSTTALLRRSPLRGVFGLRFLLPLPSTCCIWE